MSNKWFGVDSYKRGSNDNSTTLPYHLKNRVKNDSEKSAVLKFKMSHSIRNYGDETDDTKPLRARLGIPRLNQDVILYNFNIWQSDYAYPL